MVGRDPVTSLRPTSMNTPSNRRRMSLNEQQQARPRNGWYRQPQPTEPTPDAGMASSGDMGFVSAHNDTPLSRAGLLQPRSYVQSSSSYLASTSLRPSLSRNQSDIRANTVQLSNILLSPPKTSLLRRPSHSGSIHFDRKFLQSRDSFIFPTMMATEEVTEPLAASQTLSEAHSVHSSEASSSTNVADEEVRSGTSTPRGPRGRGKSPSGLSILLRQQQQNQPTTTNALSATAAVAPTPTHVNNPDAEDSPVPFDLLMARPPLDLLPDPFHGDDGDEPRPLGKAVQKSRNNETTPLLHDVERGIVHTSYTSTNGGATPRAPKISGLARRVAKMATKDGAMQAGKIFVMALPPVLLGLLLNILDGVSYGMIMFPSNEVFTNFGGIGVSMFFVTTIIAQVVYAFGGSGFPGANGSMMIEVVPFFHILANTITSEIGADKPAEVIATTMVAFSFSAILTGLTFYLLGALRLGTIIGFFPRHILVGCIGGVGWFLIQTGLAVCARMDDDEFSYSFETLKLFFGNGHVFALWFPAFLMAVLLRVITHKFHHQLIFPAFFLVIPVLFYVMIAILGLDMPTLRDAGWVFNMGESNYPWYQFYTYFDFKLTNWRALWVTMPTQFALLFFNILHPPLNVPALSISLGQEVDTNKELVSHGYSNLLGGLFGTVPNYLVYVNTLLFYRVGGTTRFAGFLLAVFTVFLLIAGPAPIGYIPIMVVGALIFVLGIDLVKEALWDTRHRVSRLEYITIASIMVCMTLWDFVIGVLFGIVVSCFFFVVQNSQNRSIRALHTGESAMSAVRRPSAHREYIREVSKQTMILKLQGFLFFGTITQVEEAIRKLVDLAQWKQNPIRFLIVDLSLVLGVDMSSAEAFVRVQRILAARGVTLVFCGFSPASTVGKALDCVELLDADFVEVFDTFNDALEWTENAYLRAWFMSQKAESATPVQRHLALPGRQKSGFALGESFVNSPRRVHIFNAAGRTIAQEGMDFFSDEAPDPFLTLNKAFSSYGNITREMFEPMIPYLLRIQAPEGTVLWNQDDDPDGLYLIESGVLKASYRFADHTETFDESMVGGTLAGELSALSGLPRNSTVMVESQAVLWKLSTDDLKQLEVENPSLARDFSLLVLKAAKIDYDILLSALAARK